MDYTSGPYSVTFPVGVMSVLLYIPIKDDKVLEINESYMLSINSSSIILKRVTVGNLDQCTVTIVDNDCKFEHHIIFGGIL